MPVAWHLLPTAAWVSVYALRQRAASRRVLAAAQRAGWSPQGAGASLAGQPRADTWVFMACVLGLLVVRLALDGQVAAVVYLVPTLACAGSAVARRRAVLLLGQHDSAWRPAGRRRGRGLRSALAVVCGCAVLVLPFSAAAAIWRLYALLGAAVLAVVLGMTLFWVQAWLPTQGQLRRSGGDAPGPPAPPTSPPRSRPGSAVPLGTAADAAAGERGLPPGPGSGVSDAPGHDDAGGGLSSPFTTRRSRRRAPGGD